MFVHTHGDIRRFGNLEGGDVTVQNHGIGLPHGSIVASLVLIQSFDLSYLTEKVANFVPIEFCHRCNTVDVADQVSFRTEKRFERGFSGRTSKQATVGSDPQFFNAWRGPILVQQRRKYRREHAANFNLPQFASAVPSNLLRFTEFVVHYGGARCFPNGGSAFYWLSRFTETESMLHSGESKLGV